MMETDDLDRYNDDTVHNMWVDYTRDVYTDKCGENFYENSCESGPVVAQKAGVNPREDTPDKLREIKAQMTACKNNICHHQKQMEMLRNKAAKIRKKLKNPNLTTVHLASLSRADSVEILEAIALHEESIKREENQLAALHKQYRKYKTIVMAGCIAATLVAALYIFILFIQ